MWSVKKLSIVTPLPDFAADALVQCVCVIIQCEDRMRRELKKRMNEDVTLKKLNSIPFGRGALKNDTLSIILHFKSLYLLLS